VTTVQGFGYLAIGVEFCVDHPDVDDQGDRARTGPGGPEARDVWQSPLPALPSAVALL
jgi:hypothetical protein